MPWRKTIAEQSSAAQSCQTVQSRAVLDCLKQLQRRAPKQLLTSTGQRSAMGTCAAPRQGFHAQANFSSKKGSVAQANPRQSPTAMPWGSGRLLDMQHAKVTDMGLRS